MTTTEPIRFSIVTPTYRRAASLMRMLDALAAQDYPHALYEVVVVLDGDDDALIDLLRKRHDPYRLRPLVQPRSGPAAARNRGLAAAEEPYVLFVDDDVLPAPSLVRRHAESHQAGDAVVIGPLLAASGTRPAPWTSWEWTTLLEQYAAMANGEWAPTPRQFYTGNASVRIDHLRAVGGFDPGFKRGEDVELAWRLHDRGLRFVFNPEAAAEHLAQRSFAAWVDAAHEYGRTDVMLERKRGGHGVPGWAPDEFNRRHRYTRLLARSVIAVPALWGPAHQMGRLAALMSDAAGRKGNAHMVCSALFAVAYWRGVTTQLGRQHVLRTLAGATGAAQAEAA